MNTAAELIAKRLIYLERFTIRDYPAAFDEFKDRCLPLFGGLSAKEDASRAAEELCRLAKESAVGLFRRGLVLDEISRLFALYLIPAALVYGGEGETLADELCRRWNERYPRYRLSVGSYEQIAGSFRTKPFGL